MFKKIGLSLFALIAVTGIALAGGAFNQYPVVGNDGTVCLSFGNNGVCNQFQPLGSANAPPTSVIPSDTNLSGGQNPQTQNVPLVLTGATILDAAPLTGATIAIPQGTARLILNPAGTIAALTVTLPIAAQCYDGQIFSVYTSQTVTSLTITPGTGTTLTPTVTTATAAAPVKLIYVKAATAWQLF